jgi:hypothetical protein
VRCFRYLDGLLVEVAGEPWGREKVLQYAKEWARFPPGPEDTYVLESHLLRGETREALLYLPEGAIVTRRELADVTAAMR